ncbi:MAG: NAD-dependent epimerase/dehydratase family protein [Armatimonadota bacterium]
MKALIVGGTRFLGLNITHRLAASGDDVFVVNRGRTEADLPDGVTRLQADIKEPGQLEAAVGDMTFDAAIHMIAMSASTAECVLDVIADRIGHYIQCGSVGVYAPLKYIPADEEHPIDPLPNEMGGFGHKLAADNRAAEICAEHNLPLTILRPSAIIGAGAVPIDLWGGREPGLFQQMLDGEPVIVPDDGRALIQFGHVADLATAFVAAAHKPEATGVFNISSRYAITLNYYTDVLAGCIGVEPNVQHMPAEQIIEKYGDSGMLNARGLRFLCHHMCYRIDKAVRELGFDPDYTAEAAIEDSVQWMFEKDIISR